MPMLMPYGDLNRVYCAGPLFNEAERNEMTRIAAALQQRGFRTFLPHADGMEFAKVQPILVGFGYDAPAAGRLLHEAIFAMDTYQVIARCGSLVCNINGRVPDEGAVAELTMAWMLGKPVVIYKEDVRSMISGRDNPLVVGQTSFEVVRRLEDLGPALAAKVAAGRCDGDGPVCLPPHLETIVDLGGRLWRKIESLAMPRAEERIARIVLEVFAGRRVLGGGEETFRGMPWTAPFSAPASGGGS
jgi:nucleoside 2-deoxyribosyltransferase